MPTIRWRKHRRKAKSLHSQELSPPPEIVLVLVVVLDFSAGEQTQVDALFEFDCRFRNVGLFRPESPPWRLVRSCQFGLAAL
jgi:hypothetical protein